MTDADLDRSYTALCQALGEVGPERSELLLAMVALGADGAAGACGRGAGADRSARATAAWSRSRR